MESTEKLSADDVKKLIGNPSAESREQTAAKIAGQFGGEGLSENERKLAEDIFRLMMKDAEVRVRKALSENLKDNPCVPHDVARAMAQDVDEVALPMLEFSEVLSEEDLLEIVRTQDSGKQTAIARRSDVSESVAEAIVDNGNEMAVATLVANDTAHLSEGTLTKVVETMGGSEAVQSGLIERSALPVTISERLVSIVSERFKDRLARKHELPPALATDLILQSREKATLGLSEGSSDEELERLVSSMDHNKRLTPSIVLRALCMGDMPFFEASLAQLAGVNLVNARVLIHDSGNLGLKGLYGKSRLPQAMYPIFEVAVIVSQETEYDGEEHDRERYSRRIIERIMTQYEELGVDIDNDDLDYLLGKVNELPGALPAA